MRNARFCCTTDTFAATPVYDPTPPAPSFSVLSKPILKLALHSIVRPKLLYYIAATAWRFRRRGWYRRPPFLPLPSNEYVAWRMYTAYGREDAEPSIEEAERYFRWAYHTRRKA